MIASGHSLNTKEVFQLSRLIKVKVTLYMTVIIYTYKSLKGSHKNSQKGIISTKSVIVRIKRNIYIYI